ncbi:MAG: hypothetical protein Q9163_003768 [Psora crenata]
MSNSGTDVLAADQNLTCITIQSCHALNFTHNSNHNVKAEHKQSLYNSYFSIFQNRHLPQSHSCMYYGIACSRGWYEIINNLSRELTAIISKHNLGPNLYIYSQIEEKISLLRVYMQAGIQEMMGAIERAVDASEHVCEDCGQEEHADRASKRATKTTTSAAATARTAAAGVLHVIPRTKSPPSQPQFICYNSGEEEHNSSDGPHPAKSTPLPRGYRHTFREIFCKGSRN